MNTSIEAPLREGLRRWQHNLSAELALSNARLGTSVRIGAVVFDVESWSWASRWRGAPAAKPPPAPWHAQRGLPTLSDRSGRSVPGPTPQAKGGAGERSSMAMVSAEPREPAGAAGCTRGA